MFFVGFFAAKQVHADWDCRQVPQNAAPGAPLVYRCVEDSTATQFKTLRGCLRGEDDFLQPEKLNIPPGNNNCVDDPRWVMRNFAALNFWSVGKMLSLAVPLVIAIGGVVCLVFMLFGAFTYIMSGGEEKKITDSMHTMTYAGLGLVVIVLGYAIVRTILFVTKINTFGF